MSIFGSFIDIPKEVDKTFVSITERLAKEHEIPEDKVRIMTTMKAEPKKHMQFWLCDGRTNQVIKQLDMKKYL